MITYLIMAIDQAEKIKDIDRSEWIGVQYEVENGALIATETEQESKGWNPQELAEVQERYVTELTHGGMAVGAFDGETLAGFGVLANQFRGPENNQLQVDLLYVSRQYRRQGIGQALLNMLRDEARSRGAGWLYISATETESAVSFYRSQGSLPTQEPDKELFAKEPKDIHMLLKL